MVTAVESEPGPARRTDRPRGVLVADDEPLVGQMLRQFVEALGLRAWVCTDGVQALAAFEEHRAQIDVVLLDLVMPGLDGLDTLALLRKLDPQVRVALMTGYCAPSEEDMARAGADALFFKPFDFAQLGQFLGAPVIGPSANGPRPEARDQRPEVRGPTAPIFDL